MARHIWADGDALTTTRLNGLPGGRIVGASGSAQTGITSSATDLTGLSVTFTGEASRWYRATLFLPRVDQVTSAGIVTATIATSANAVLAASPLSLAAGGSGWFNVQYIVTGVSGSTTWKGRLHTSAGSVNTVVQGPLFLMVEDLGA